MRDYRVKGIGLNNVVVGDGGNNTLYGTDGDDTLRGLSGNDVLFGGKGDDRYYGGNGTDNLVDDRDGDDRLFGGGGRDFLRIERHPLSGGPDISHVVLDGGSGNDEIAIYGGGAARVVTGTVAGGIGNDTINVFSNSGLLTIDAGDGDDAISLISASGTGITLGAGADVIAISDLSDAIVATLEDYTPGEDRFDILDLLRSALTNWTGDNPFSTGHLRLVQDDTDVLLQIDADGGGDDWQDFALFKNHVTGDFSAADFVGFAPDGTPAAGLSMHGNNKANQIAGSVGADTIDGRGGNDLISGLEGGDTIRGGSGDDVIYGGLGDDVVYGEDGNDFLDTFGSDTVYGGLGNDQFNVSALTTAYGSPIVHGDDGDDRFFIDGGGEDMGVATVFGDAGNDTFNVSGDDALDLHGGDGDDRFVLSAFDGDLHIDTGAGHDTIVFSPATALPGLVLDGFEAGEDGDALAVYDYFLATLPSWDGTSNPFATGNARLTQDGSSALLQVDPDGGSDTWQTLVTFANTDVAALTAKNLGGYPADGSPPQGITFNGDANANNFAGGIGADTLNGNGGNDTLNGVAGDDIIDGGSGDDNLDGGWASMCCMAETTVII